MRRIDLLTSVRRHRAWLVAGLLLGLLVGGVLSLTAVRTYTSSTQLFVGTAGTTATSDAYEGNLFSQQRVASYAQILTSRELAQEVIDAQQLPLTSREVAAKVTATPRPETVVLDVQVTDTSAERAQSIATGLAQAFTARVTELETPPGSTTSTVRVETIQAADFNPDPISPDVVGNLWRGAATGLVLGLVAALLIGRLDRSVRDVEDAEGSTGAAVVGRLFENRELRRKHVSGGLGDQSATAEAYRALRVNLRYLSGDRAPGVVVVAGPVRGEGASTVAVNLAVSLARAGSRVTLIDADLRRPRVRRYLGLPDGPGLAEVLAGTSELRSVVQPWEDGRLSVIGAGALPADPEAALGSPRMRALLDTLRDQQDVVVVDAPPLLPVVDGAVISAMADTSLLVARYGRTRREHLAEAAAAVARVRVPSIGVAINRMPRRSVEATAGSRTYGPDSRRPRAGAPVGAPSPTTDHRGTRGPGGADASSLEEA
ncbi:polysaccharide biosynthesis tyrosine autokinase [Blastococcus sp. URHD0036]|uniref:polysaccharide biosynthesis tyrosine autokinase n=1 Tax=Blastococcus sp. URHD0036 TaxID=1380356 RepID=UPI00068A0E5B|nr:polysaccharide biosynthesis tyrosine autokinase [Blastococcus sp. URHD0036]